MEIKKLVMTLFGESNFILLLLASLLVITVFMALSLAAFPAADDYCYAVEVRNYGFVGSLVGWYSAWSGRFSATALMNLISLSRDIKETYALVLISAQLVMLAAIFAFLRALFQYRYSLRFVALLTLTAYVIFLTGLPDIAQYMYWTMGIADYALGNVSLLLLLAIGAQQELGGQSKRMFSMLRFAVAAMVAIFAVGTNELTLISVLGKRRTSRRKFNQRGRIERKL